MKPLTTVLAFTDLSLADQHAVQRAALLAHGHGAELHILHVRASAPSIDSDARSRAALRRCATEIARRYDVPVRVDLRVGDPLETVLQASPAADLVVLGHRSASGLETWRRARFVKRLLEVCRSPVLVVRAPAHGPYRRVLLPVDLSAGSDSALRVAARVARGAGLHVFHAVDSHRESLLRRADVDESVIVEARAIEAAGIAARMRRSVVRLGLDSRRMSFAVRSGAAVPATLHQASVLAADLIVAGRQPKSTFADVLLGSVSSRLLCAAACDTLIVPAAGGEADRRLPVSLAGRGRTA
jgi:nucleotide-binding universal stress UspA family protein